MDIRTDLLTPLSPRHPWAPLDGLSDADLLDSSVTFEAVVHRDLTIAEVAALVAPGRVIGRQPASAPVADRITVAVHQMSRLPMIDVLEVGERLDASPAVLSYRVIAGAPAIHRAGGER